MRQVYPDEGLTKLLKIIASNGGDGLVWRLYVNDFDPDFGIVLGDLTLAGAWGTIVLTDAEFTDSQVIAHVGAIEAETVSFTNDTGNAIAVYGVAVYDDASQTLVMCQRFEDAPIVVEDGLSIEIDPVLGDYSDPFVPAIDGGTF